MLKISLKKLREYDRLSLFLYFLLALVIALAFYVYFAHYLDPVSADQVGGLRGHTGFNPARLKPY